jgi:hypothetical protein
MPELTRFDHDIDIIDPSEGPVVSRFERLDREVDLIDRAILSGSTLEVRSDGTRIILALTPEGPSGKYPTLEVGLISLGEVLNGDPLEDVEGGCPGIDPVDQELLKGSILTIKGLGERLIAVWKRTLPERTYQHKGLTHRVHRTGTRTAVAILSHKSRGVAKSALEATEVIAEGSILNKT